MDIKKLLQSGLKELSISCSESQINSFITFLSELKKWNKTYSLTAITSDHDIVVKHFLDSLLFLNVIPDEGIKLGDAGSGAGFPGIPIKILRPDFEISLIEPTGKKAAFLRHIIRRLKLQHITVIEKRLENLSSEFEKYFDIIVSRATFDIQTFQKLSCPYIKNSGRLILAKGPKFSEELKYTKPPLDKKTIIELIKTTLPHSDAERCLVILRCDS